MAKKKKKQKEKIDNISDEGEVIDDNIWQDTYEDDVIDSDMMYEEEEFE